MVLICSLVHILVKVYKADENLMASSKKFPPMRTNFSILPFFRKSGKCNRELKIGKDDIVDSIVEVFILLLRRVSEME